MRILYTILLLILFPVAAAAQFYVTGDDPGKLKWNFIDTESFRIIYPQKADSLAKIYGYQLEKYKIPVSRSTGFMAGEGDRRIMPVVLHTFNGSNGSVAWAPKRMDLFTIPTAYNPTPMPWSTMLAVHEGRHVTQMQFGMTKVHKPFGYVFGEMWNILVSLVYPGMYFLEGDAVIAETALTNSGRGRTADFLNYYRVAFDQGDFRNFTRWQYGSQIHYTPNHYALGYMRLATSRYIYDYPTIMKDGYNMANRKIFNLSPFLTLVKAKSGKKNDESFREICDTIHGIWSRDAEKRAPFMIMEPVTKETRRYTDYGKTIIIGSDIYTIKKGFVHTPTLVKIDSTGNERFISRFSHNTSRLSYENGTFFWSEEIPDIRWSMKSDSKIRSLRLSDKKRKSLTDRTELLFNPAIKNGKRAATQYFTNGRSAINIDGEIFTAPDSIQIVETTWIGDFVYASAIAENGFGIYRLDPSCGEWNLILEPQPVKMQCFNSSNDEALEFICDRTGVNELYYLDPTSGELFQKTSTRYGATDFCYSDDGKYLYFSSQTLKGMRMFRTPVDSLINRKVSYSDAHRYILADNLSDQEHRLAEEDGYTEAVENVNVTFSEPKKYRKATHMFNIHSWAPVYVSVDNIMNTSFDYIYQAASLGVTGIIQNRLATGVGEIGYSAHKDPYDKSKWRHSGHFKYTYSGFYPVFEFKFDINDRAAIQSNLNKIVISSGNDETMFSYKLLDIPYIEGKITTYIPFNFSSGGWNRGLIPQISYKISNDIINSTTVILDGTDAGLGTDPYGPSFIGKTDGKFSINHNLRGSLRGYCSQSIPNSAVFPRFGIGAEIGVMWDCSSSDILSPMGYAYMYGYLPGIIRTQGLKLTATHQIKLKNDAIFGQAYVKVLPRGLSDNSQILQWVSRQYVSATKLTADYAIPIYIGDISIGKGFLYIKRLTITPHADYTRAGKYNLLSLGTSLTLDLNGVIWIGWPVSVGATYSYNGLCDFNTLQNISGIPMKKNHIGFLFNVSF